MASQNTMDLVTSFGPTLLAGLLAGQGNKVDKNARARNDLANLLGVQQNAAQFGGQSGQLQFDTLNQNNSDQGAALTKTAGTPYELAGASQDARLKGIIGPQLAGLLGVKGVNMPTGAYDLYNKMGSDQFLGERLSQLGEGNALSSPQSSPMNLSSLINKQTATPLQSSLNDFSTTQHNKYTSGEKNYSDSMANAVAGYQGAAGNYETGLQKLQQDEQAKSQGGGIWKKLLGIGALAAIPFTGGISGALAGATGLGTAASAGLVGSGLGAASAFGSGSNPLLGAIMGGAGGAMFGPGGKFGKSIIPKISDNYLNKLPPGAMPMTGSRNALSNIYNPPRG